MKKNLEEKQVAMRDRWENVEQPSFKTPEEFRWRLTYSERRVLGMLQEQGHKEVIRNGWPDFGVIVNGKLVGIEVKRGTNDRLNEDQRNTYKLLKRAGIEVIIVEDNGYLCGILRQLKGKV